MHIKAQADIALNPLIGGAGDLGLGITGLSLGAGLAVLGLMVKALLLH